MWEQERSPSNWESGDNRYQCNLYPKGTGEGHYWEKNSASVFPGLTPTAQHRHLHLHCDEILKSSERQASLWLTAHSRSRTPADAIVRILQEVKERLSDLFLAKCLQRVFAVKHLYCISAYTLFRAGQCAHYFQMYCHSICSLSDLNNLIWFLEKQQNRAGWNGVLFGSGRAIRQCSVGRCVSNENKREFNCSHLPWYNTVCWS